MALSTGQLGNIELPNKEPARLNLSTDSADYLGPFILDHFYGLKALADSLHDVQLEKRREERLLAKPQGKVNDSLSKASKPKKEKDLGDLIVFANYDNAIYEPVTNASVKVTGPTSLEGNTDESGKISFTRIPVGSYKVEANIGTLEPQSYSVSVTKDASQEAKLVFPCVHFDQALDVAAYMVAEFQKNLRRSEVDIMKKSNAYDAVKEANKWQESLKDDNWLEKIAAGMTRPDFGQLELSSKIVSLAHWTKLVRQGGEWDHKWIIAENKAFSTAGNSTRWHHKYNDFEYFYDIWSNVHYGYLGAYSGFSNSMLLDGAGLEQLGTDGLHPNKEIANNSEVNGEGLRKYDDTTDQISIKLGIDLYSSYPDPNNISPELLMNAITQQPYPIKEGSKLEHRCGPHHQD